MPPFRATEHTRRQPFIEALQRKLSSKDFKVFNELTFRSGLRVKIPDLVILKEGRYRVHEDDVEVDSGGVAAIIETKRAEIASGMAQVSVYQSLVRKEVGPANVLVATTFDKAWIHDERASTGGITASLELDQLVGTISDAIEKGVAPSRGVEYKEEEYVEFLNAAVDLLVPFTRQIPEARRKRLTGIFLAETLDAELSEDPEVQEELRSTSEKAASFIVVNQIFFYHLLSSRTGKFKPLKVPTKLSDVSKAFEHVLAFDFGSIYSARIIDLLPEDSEETVGGIVEQVRLLRIEHMGSDLIGKVFHRLIPEALRKRIAAYYTTNAAARLLALLCIEDTSAIVGDLACGSGTMLVEAYHRKQELNSEKIEKCKLHDKLLSELYGVDICLFSGQLAAMNLFIQEIECFPKPMNISIDDAFHLPPGVQRVLSVEQSVHSDFVQVRGKMRMPSAFQAIIMNPPFTDRRRMSEAYVAEVDKVMKRRGLDQFVSGQFHLGLYFMLHARDFLARGGRMGLVIPEAILQNVSTGGIKRFIVENFHVLTIISSDAQVAFSDGPDWKEIMLVLERKKKQAEPKHTKLVTLKEELTYTSAAAVHRLMIATDREAATSPEADITLCKAGELEKQGDWIAILRQVPVLNDIRKLAEGRLCRLGEAMYAVS
jgi:type I restriction-modification system DNA methylase subunit